MARLAALTLVVLCLVTVDGGGPGASVVPLTVMATILSALLAKLTGIPPPPPSSSGPHVHSGTAGRSMTKAPSPWSLSFDEERMMMKGLHTHGTIIQIRAFS